MSDESKSDGMESTGVSDTAEKTVTDFTQVASCAVGAKPERRRQNLRAKLEREQFDRQKEMDQSFLTTLRSMFKTSA